MKQENIALWLGPKWRMRLPILVFFLIVLTLVLAYSAFGSNDKPTHILARERPYEGCKVYRPADHAFGPSEWACPPREQKTVDLKKKKKSP